MLSIDEVQKTYSNGVVALDSFSLEIKPGLFGLLGPNGAGKSTLMRTIATLQRPDSGTIRFGGIDVLNQPQAIRQTLGYLPQDFGVYPRISAFDLLEHLAILKGYTDKQQRRQEIARLLNKTNLEAKRNAAVSTFSGGMRQRFGIAQALLGNPKLIIVDEPTAGLDPAEKKRFHALLADLSRDKVLLLSTHIVDDVEELCPDVAVMANGRLLMAGNTDDLINSLNGKLWEKPVTHAELAAHQADERTISTRLKAGEPIVHTVAEHSPGDGFRPRKPNLEDVYFHALKANQ